EVKVHVINYLPLNSPILKLRCQSKDNDLGYHTLPVNNDYHWSFCETLFGQTLFFCRFYWGSKQKVFDVFRAKYSREYNSEHFWLAKSDGFYYATENLTSSFTKRFDWSRIQQYYVL
ncbi:hypothetical protein PHJA_002831100, partial [Phtheirospermum japonicum]